MKAKQNYIVLGDFNINLDNVNQAQASINYSDHVNSICCSQIITKATRTTEFTATVVDQIYVNPTVMSDLSKCNQPISNKA